MKTRLPIDTLLGIDMTKPNVARVYDYLLGGTANFPADRVAAERAVAALPSLAQQCRENRAFLRRAVHHLAERDITQFLDIGSGLPTQENVHQVAQRVVTWARVVYVDHDPVVVTHATHLLGNAQFTRIIQGDMTDPESILGHATVRRLIHRTQPVAVLLLAALHFLSDTEARALLDALKAFMAPGSYIAISHLASDGSPEEMERFRRAYARDVTDTYPRSYREVADLLAGFDLVPPGIVSLDSWRPEKAAKIQGPTIAYAAVARKP